MSTKIILAANTSWFLYNFRLSLAKYLRNLGNEVVLLAPSDKYSASLVAAGFRWIDWSLGRQSTSAFRESTSVFQTAQIYRQEKPDLVHHFTIKPVLYGSIAARLAGVRAVVNSITGRGYVFLGRDQKARFILPLVKGLYRVAYQHSNIYTIFENKEDLKYFCSEGLIPQEHSSLIESVGVDPEAFHPEPEPTNGPPLVVLPARLLWDKGVGTLVEAARTLHQQVNVRIALVGEPDPGNPTAISEEQLHKWENEGIIEWWGWKEDMRPVYQQSTIITLPSFAEGVPKALLEAAACGRPIITTDVPGCRDVVQDGVNGYLVPPNDPESLAAALRKLITDPDTRQRMGSAGRQLILSRFTQDQINKATVQIYDVGLNPSN